MPRFVSNLFPTFTPPGYKISHIRQYQFAAKFIKNKKVLDAASGTGYGSEILRVNGNQVVGIDINPENIRFARATFSSNQYLVANMENLHFLSDEEFDAAVSIQTIEHLWYPTKAIKEIYRILKSNGLFIGSIPANFKHIMPPDVEGLNAYLFNDLQNILLSQFQKIRWFYHFLHTNNIQSVTKEWLKKIKRHSGDFMFITTK